MEIIRGGGKGRGERGRGNEAKRKNESFLLLLFLMVGLVRLFSIVSWKLRRREDGGEGGNPHVAWRSFVMFSHNFARNSMSV